MGNREARNQKRLAKHKAKRAEKRTLLARQASTDPAVRLARAADWPIVAALVPERWESGIGQLVLVRRAPGGLLACGVYLVDLYCLGVKNAFWKLVTKPQLDDLVSRIESHGALQEVSPEHFAKLVLDSAAYARSLGFSPHPDFRAAKMLLDGIDPTQCLTEFEFGKDGKPFYIRGPNETFARAKVIAAKIQAMGGHTLFIMDETSPHDMSELSGARMMGADSIDDDDDDGDDDE